MMHAEECAGRVQVELLEKNDIQITEFKSDYKDVSKAEEAIIVGRARQDYLLPCVDRVGF